MSKAPQCPSTVGEQDAAKPRPELLANAANGRAYWRGLDEIADTPAFRDRLEREFPAFASELQGGSRREFMKLMAAGFALAGAVSVPGCRRPDNPIMTYQSNPEDIVIGKATYYASAMPLPGGGAEGVLVEAHEGRPTKIEGNPLHPWNQGRSSVHAQASILDLYDPDRFTGVTTRGADGSRHRSTWKDFEAFAGEHFKQYDASQGAGLAFLVEKATSPSRDAMKARILKRWPKALWAAYEAVDRENALAGSRLALGKACHEVLSVEKAKVIVALDREFLAGSGEGSSMPAARGFGAGRKVRTHDGPQSAMSRLYAIEGAMSLAGGAADHRLRLRPSQIGLYVAGLAGAVAKLMGGAPTLAFAADPASAATELGIDAKWFTAVADDLVNGVGGEKRQRGETLVLVGETQPASVHAMAIALNAALGNLGSTVRYVPAAGDAGADSTESIRGVVQQMGAISTLVMIGVNPAYTAPADLDFAARLAKVKTSIHVSLREDETGPLSTWRLPRAHYLESWGDVDALDGVRSVVQPVIAPIAWETGGVEAARSDLEVLALIAGDEVREGHEIVRRTWREALKLEGAAFEKAWRRALHNGLLEGTGGGAKGETSVNASAVADAASRPRTRVPADDIEVVFHASPTAHDGRFANLGWLQELPHQVSKVTWDNPALMSPATAKKLEVNDGQLVWITLNGRTAQAPVWRIPGMADGVIVLELGYGRANAGRVGTGVGFDLYPLRTSEHARHAVGAKIEARGGSIKIACTQTHWSMEGRPLILETDVHAWRKHGGEPPMQTKDAYGREKTVRFAERIPPSPDAHLPVNEDMYRDWQAHDYSASPQWGMSVDLTSCTGCSACTIACQAENNVPIVGKAEVLTGREMHWIRLDRYFASPYPDLQDGLSRDFGTSGPYTGGRTGRDVDMLFMPVMCMHCENAPCETVCPVNATAHGDEGLNEMAYNRCIGTRYCSNNCPYKVRRFNFFDYATKRLNGDYVGKELLGKAAPRADLVPPRLREKVNEGAGEIQTMQFNPNVTVRERGVMEKCTYCIQRINEGRIQAKLEGMTAFPDGYVVTACQQACPTGAIEFGDILDPSSKVAAARAHALSYGLLTYLNTKPRTTYMLRLRNPNVLLRDAVEDPFHDHHGGAHDANGSHAEPLKEAGHVMSLPVLESRRSAAVGVVSKALAGLGGLA